jgi:hypothetical protein
MLTMTLTGIAADLRNRDFGIAALAVACGLVAAVLVAAAITSQRPAPWQHR